MPKQSFAPAGEPRSVPDTDEARRLAEEELPDDGDPFDKPTHKPVAPIARTHDAQGRQLPPSHPRTVEPAPGFDWDEAEPVLAGWHQRIIEDMRRIMETPGDTGDAGDPTRVLTLPEGHVSAQQTPADVLRDMEAEGGSLDDPEWAERMQQAMDATGQEDAEDILLDYDRGDL